MKLFHIGIQSGDPLTHGQQRITPQSLIAWLRIPWPGGGYGITFQQPIAVEVQSGGGAARRLPVINITLLATTGIFITALAAAMLLWRINHE